MKTESKFSPLICPVDYSPLRIEDNLLKCGDSHTYSLKNEIPRVLVSKTQYADAFGDQWNKYRVTQLDSYTKTTITKDRIVRCLGDELCLKLSENEPVQILETGCGAGRFTEILLSFRDAFVTSTDLSSAVEANQANCPQSERHRIVQCDINALPFADESYDVVICLGVIQHTPSPEKTIEALYRQVKRGGWLVIDHYAPNISYYTKVTGLALRPILKRLSPISGMKATEMLTKIFFPFHRSVRSNRLMQMILSRFSPLLTFFQEHPELNDDLQYEWALLDTHDYLTDYYKFLRTKEQIRKILISLGAEKVWVAKGGNGVEARCRKPL